MQKLLFFASNNHTRIFFLEKMQVLKIPMICPFEARSKKNVENYFTTARAFVLH